MGDIKLFRTEADGVQELEGSAVAVEKALQQLVEHHLEEFLGIRFLKSEYSTGQVHGGRIDTLGIDENNNPVIIEYKRSTNQNVINQGLFYLDWLMDHQAEFTLLAMKELGPAIEEEIDWTNPRLVCIAGDFTRYDEHAVLQINRNIELIRYRRYHDEFLLLELVNSATASSEAPTTPTTSTSATVSDYLAKADEQLQQLFDDLDEWTMALGDDVTRRELKNYFAYRRIKNFVCAEVHPQARKLTLFVKVSPDEVTLEEGFTRDVREIGHFGTGDLEITVRDQADLERAKVLIERSYEMS